MQEQNTAPRPGLEPELPDPEPLGHRASHMEEKRDVLVELNV